MEYSLLMRRAKPLAANCVPRVAINGWTLNFAMTNPFNNPNTTPHSSPPIIDKYMLYDAKYAVIILVSAATAPTDKSRQPIKKQRLTPIPIMPTSDAIRITLYKFLL